MPADDFKIGHGQDRATGSSAYPADDAATGARGGQGGASHPDPDRPPTGLVRVVRYGPAEFERATEYLGEERITFRYTSEGIVFWAPERGECLLTNEKMAEALRKAKAEHQGPNTSEEIERAVCWVTESGRTRGMYLGDPSLADGFDATNSVRLCDRCEDEYGVSAGADAGDRACAVCGQHDAPHTYVRVWQAMIDSLRR